jgi:hypothetical protein
LFLSPSLLSPSLLARLAASGFGIGAGLATGRRWLSVVIAIPLVPFAVAALFVLGLGGRVRCWHEREGSQRRGNERTQHNTTTAGIAQQPGQGIKPDRVHRASSVYWRTAT